MVELLKTKLFIPRPRKKLVSRPRLVERLNAGLDRKITLIAAPAGFGKTSLLSEWIPQSPRCVTWFSLDEGDNSPMLFWAYFIAALQTLSPEIGKGAQALFQSLQAPPNKIILTMLINEITAFEDSFVHVFDDYHLIQSTEVDEGLAFLIEHQPPNLHLVINTRIDPALPLSRLRARTELNELRANDLRFTTEEAAIFLIREVGLHLSTENITALEARTEGWIAGLQIAALSMQGHEDISGFIKAFSGSHRHILGYLAEEVLNHLSKNTLNFLLQTSILDRLCGPLCDAMTGDTGGQALLENLEHANLFVTPLDDVGGWYRYHHLFAEVLQARLQQTKPDRIPELNRRASAWFEQNGQMSEAVTYAMAAQDFSRAADLVEVIGVTLFAQPAVQYSLQNWLTTLPDAVVQHRPRLHLIHAWQRFDRSDIIGAIHAVDDAEQAVERTLGVSETRASQNLRGAIAALRAFLYTFTHEPDIDQVIAWAKDALADLEPDHHNFRGLAAAALAFVYVFRGSLDDVVRASLEAAEDARAAGNVYLATFASVSRILISRAQGKLRYAMAVCREALDWMAHRSAQDSPSMSALNTALADMLREDNDLAEAQRCAELSMQQADNGANPTQAMFCRFALARVKQAQGDWDAALGLLAQVTERLPPDSPMLHPSLIPATTAQWQLACGRLAPALLWAQATEWEEGSLASIRTSTDLVWRCEHLWIARAQVFIAQGRASSDKRLMEETKAYLIRQQTFAEKAGLGLLRIKVLLLQAVVNQILNEASQATVCIEQALFLAEPEGYLRLFVDEGEPVRLLLLDYQSNLKKKLHDGVDSESLRLSTYTDKLLAAFFQPAPVKKSKQAAIPEPLSERELDILRLIATGSSNKEIAENLIIAVSTVKTHINNIYGKLGTSRRTQAIAIAREKGLL